MLEEFESETEVPSSVETLVFPGFTIVFAILFAQEDGEVGSGGYERREHVAGAEQAEFVLDVDGDVDEIALKCDVLSLDVAATMGIEQGSVHTKSHYWYADFGHYTAGETEAVILVESVLVESELIDGHTGLDAETNLS